MKKSNPAQTATITIILTTIILPIMWESNYANADLFAPTWLKTGTYANTKQETF
jgi:hypothetical protein